MNMKKRILTIALGFAMAVSAWAVPLTVTATEGGQAQPTEMEINYAKPIQSNEIKDWPQGPQVYAQSAIVLDRKSVV